MEITLQYGGRPEIIYDFDSLQGNSAKNEKFSKTVIVHTLKIWSEDSRNDERSLEIAWNKKISSS